MQPVPVPQHLDAIIEAVTHNKVALIIKRNKAWTIELPVAASFAAHAAHVHAIAQAKHLNAPIHAAIMNNNVALGVNGNANGQLELPCATSLAADAANVSPVTIPQHLHTMIATINYNKVTRAIKRNALGTNELAIV